MSEIEKMKRYIEITNAGDLPRYEINMAEALELKHYPYIIDAIWLAFSYGRAKGYRAAKAEVRR